jgi:hypothetical protein
MNRIPLSVSFAATLILPSCTKIYTGEELSSKEIEHIKKLGLLDSGEEIYQFYSNNGVKGAGNFYTTKRVARYWHHQQDKQNEFAYYKDIARISLTYHPHGDFVIPSMTIIKNDSTQFKVYAEGEEAEVKSFFDNIQTHWRAEK